MISSSSGNELIDVGWRELAIKMLAQAVRTNDIEFLVSDDCLAIVRALGIRDEAFLNQVDCLFLEEIYSI